MANLSGIRLQVGRVSGSTEFAIVTGTVSWSNREQEENLTYRVRASLRERDGARDTWNMLPDGRITQVTRGDADDLVPNTGNEIGSITLLPNNQSSRPFEIRRNFDFGGQESGNEEYYAVVTVVPEIRGDLAFSNEVSSNLG